MKKGKLFYIKLVLFLIFILFVVIYLVSNKIGKLEDISVKATGEIIIVNGSGKDDTNSDDIYLYIKEGNEESERISISNYRTGTGNFYSKEEIISNIDKEGNEKKDGIDVESETYSWREVNSLNIFNNKKFNQKKIIAPGSKGSYEFIIKNLSNTPVSYMISFGEDYDFFVNMKYKLKKNEEYVIGSNQEYVSIKDLVLQENKILSNSINRYVLEWYWDSDETDTIAGINGGVYSLQLLIDTSLTT